QGNVTSLDITVSGNMSLAGLTVNVSSLDFTYNSKASSGSTSQFEIDGGTVTVTAGSGFSLMGTFGTPGLVIQNGSLTSLDVSITTNLNVGGLSLQTKNLDLQYTSNNGGDFEIASGGSVSATAGSNITFSGVFGSGSNPGLAIQQGSLTSLDITVSGNMSVAGLTVNVSSLDFTYKNTNGGQFEIDGGTVSMTAGSAFSLMGTFGTPGLVIQNGSLTALDVAITSDISVGGLS